jgi:hypothetical protein
LQYNERKQYAMREFLRKTKFVLLMLVPSVVIFFGSTAQAVSNSISQGYKTKDSSVSAGMAVSLSDEAESTKFVEATTQQNASKFVGIITTIDENLLSLTDASSDVLVTTTGEAAAYMSDLNGEPKTGDLIAVSPIKGVLMKANSVGDQSLVVGVALEDFSGVKSSTKDVTDAQGATKVVRVGKGRIEINKDIVARNDPNEGKSFIVLAGQSITGKEVGQAQVIASLVVLLIILILEGSIIYGAIHSTIGALGRNPLSRKAVFKQLLQVSWLALIVLFFGLGAIYLILFI